MRWSAEGEELGEEASPCWSGRPQRAGWIMALGEAAPPSSGGGLGGAVSGAWMAVDFPITIAKRGSATVARSREVGTIISIPWVLSMIFIPVLPNISCFGE